MGQQLLDTSSLYDGKGNGQLIVRMGERICYKVTESQGIRRRCQLDLVLNTYVNISLNDSYYHQAF